MRISFEEREKLVSLEQVAFSKSSGYQFVQNHSSEKKLFLPKVLPIAIVFLKVCYRIKGCDLSKSNKTQSKLGSAVLSEDRVAC